MTQAVERFCNSLGVRDGAAALEELLERSAGCGSMETRLHLVDWWSIAPFSPHDIKVPSVHLHVEMHALGTALGASDAVVDIEECVRAMRASDRLKVGHRVAGALVNGALSPGGAQQLAAQLLGSPPSSQPGSTPDWPPGVIVDPAESTASTGHAAALVDGRSPATDRSLVEVSDALHVLGPRQAHIELRKLELKFAVALRDRDGAEAVAEHIARYVRGATDALRARLEDECRYSDQHSELVSTLQRLLRHFEASCEWMASHPRSPGV
ncbi:MAG: hypothetical protein ACO4AY_14810 [Ilumatobacteraceae bacterium]